MPVSKRRIVQTGAFHSAGAPRAAGLAMIERLDGPVPCAGRFYNLWL